MTIWIPDLIALAVLAWLGRKYWRGDHIKYVKDLPTTSTGRPIFPPFTRHRLRR